MTKKRKGVSQPCPFCGGDEIKISVVQGGPRGLRQAIAHCMNCGAEVRAFSDPMYGMKFEEHTGFRATYDQANRQARERVIEKWDTRKSR